MFEQVVFAGGGNRCWWQAGFWDVVQPALKVAPRAVAAVSAGAATACLIWSRGSRAGLAHYRRALRDNVRNVHWRNLFRRGAPLFPHEAIYRQAIAALLSDGGFERLRTEAPDIRITFTRMPRHRTVQASLVSAAVLHWLERRFCHALRPSSAGPRLGFERGVAHVRDCRSEEELASLLLASACTPPFTRLIERDGAPVLDGGLIDNVPVGALEPDRPTLVLLAAHHADRPDAWALDGRIHVQPSAPPPMQAWDYTSADGMQATYDMGRRDAERFLVAHARLAGSARAAGSA